MIAARRGRRVLLGLDLQDPLWTLLLELYRARLDGRPLHWPPLAQEAELAHLVTAGLAVRDGPHAALTDPAAAALHRQLEAERRALTL